jgi:hypothetical protein
VISFAQPVGEKKRDKGHAGIGIIFLPWRWTVPQVTVERFVVDGTTIGESRTPHFHPAEKDYRCSKTCLPATDRSSFADARHCAYHLRHMDADGRMIADKKFILLETPYNLYNSIRRVEPDNAASRAYYAHMARVGIGYGLMIFGAWVGAGAGIAQLGEQHYPPSVDN